MTALSAEYEQKCRSDYKDWRVYNKEVFQQSLEAKLIQFSGEDSEQHGRLKEVREMLLNFDTSSPIVLSKRVSNNFIRNDIRIYQDSKPADSDFSEISAFIESFQIYSNW